MTYQNDNFNDRNFTTGNTELPDGEYRYYKDRIYQDAASEQAQQTAASGYTPPDANKKSTGRKKKGTALLLAGCLVLSMVGGAGGAVIAAKSGLLSTGLRRSVSRGRGPLLRWFRCLRCRRQLFRCGTAGGG